jgi:hypothetical protein
MADAPHTDLAALLADPGRVAEVPAVELPALAIQLAALQTAVAVRLHRLAVEQDGDDCECFDVEEVSRRLKCSVDLVRERGEQWGIAKVLARDTRGRPSRVVYPKGLLRRYLAEGSDLSKKAARGGHA